MGDHLVLVVDDDPSLRLLCRVNLSLEGYDVAEAANLTEARAALGNGVDLVLLDMHIGSERGLDLLEDVRRVNRRIPVALLTGTAEVAPEDRQLVQALIPKPFRLEELIDTVRRLVDRADFEAQLQSAR
jgi:DNA-binding NtrC family response regulator